jgi:hypothetical protein
MAKSATAATTRRPAGDLGEFFERYGSILETVARYVHAKVERGHVHTPTKQAARWIAHDLPTLYRKTFGKTPKALKVWRVMSMLSHARYLGAYEALDIRCVPGRGLTVVSKPRKGSGKKIRAAGLRVIRGGKA